MQTFWCQLRGVVAPTTVSLSVAVKTAVSRRQAKAAGPRAEQWTHGDVGGAGRECGSARFAVADQLVGRAAVQSVVGVVAPVHDPVLQHVGDEEPDTDELQQEPGHVSQQRAPVVCKRNTQSL